MNASRQNLDGPGKLTPATGQRTVLCDGIDYEQVISPDGDNRINKAFDILFQEVMRIRISKKPHETICPCPG